jgi:hypothetical protein
MTLHNITKFYAECFSVRPKITSNFPIIATLKISAKKKIIQIKLVGMSMIFNVQNFIYLNAAIYVFLSVNKMWILKITRPPYSYVFTAFRKSGHNENSSASEGLLSAYKFLWYFIDWWKFSIHLRSLNARHFGMAEATGIQITSSISSSVAWPPYWIL